jgi:hypothetical protein
MRSRIFIYTALWMLSALAQAQDDDDIARKSVDPTAPLPAVTFQADHSASLWAGKGQRTSYGLAVSNPYLLWKQPNLLHVVIPYTTGTGIDPGQGSTQITNLLVFSRPWGRFGAGLDANLNSPRAGREGVQYGPALGFAVQSRDCRAGLLNANFLSKEVSLSAVQLIAGCTMGSGWTVSAGGFTAIYNWKTGKLLEMPLSVQLGKVVQAGGQPLQFFVNPRYNLQNTPGTFQWSIVAGITFVAAPI